MNAMQAIGGGSFLLVSGILGIRLLALAYRNRALPELLLGLSFLLGGTFGAIIEANAGVVAQQGGDGGSMLAVGKALGLVAMFTNSLFTYWVFRRGQIAGKCVIGAVVLLTSAGYIGHFSSGAFSTGVVEPLWFWVEFLGRIVSASWLGAEAFLYFGAMRRRVALGLAEPILANRFLLWTIASCTGVVFLCTSVPPMFLTEGLLVEIDMYLFAAAGLATASAYWLAFFPPAAYRKFVERNATPA
jgi:hypothetical protein